MKYSSHADIYSYQDAPDVLINNFNIKNVKKLQELEKIYTEPRISQYKKYPSGNYDLKHFQAMHKYIFQDVYPWAGEIRQVVIAKNDHMFCAPNYMDKAFSNIHKEFLKSNFLKNVKKSELYKTLAYYHGEVNMVHPFRDGNGRTTRAFLSLMVYKAHGFHLDYDGINKNEFIQASKDCTYFDYKKMEDLYKYIIKQSLPKTKTQLKDLSR